MSDRFYVATENEILSGITTDIYFVRTEEVLRRKERNPRVVAEISTSSKMWGILCGVQEVLSLMEGRNVNIYGMDDGALFRGNEPVMVIEGNYLDFCIFETPILGFLCHASGIATKTARMKLYAGDSKILSFGTRRQHPAIAPFIEKSAYIGGADGFSNVSAERFLKMRASGTMPHALIICMGDQREAWRAFDEVVSEEVPRILLCDTYCDEKTEVIMALETLGKRVHAIRIDTPKSRRGDIKSILSEIRWEMNLRGFRDVKIVLSGGVDEEDVRELRDIVDIFGIGTSIASAPPVDFAMDIVEVEGEPRAKRGKRGGKKQLYRNMETLEDVVLPHGWEAPEGFEEMLKPLMIEGRIVREQNIEDARRRALEYIEKLRKSEPSV